MATSSPLRIEVVRLLPATPAEVFALMADRNHWPAYYPDFVRFAEPVPANWWDPGDVVTVITRLLGREVAVVMTMERLEPAQLVRYTSRQRGLPDAHHERAFIDHPAGCVFLATISYTPRRGLLGLVDRALIRPAVVRKLRRAGANLARLVGAPRRHHL